MKESNGISYPCAYLLGTQSIVFAEEAIKNQNYVCISCSSPMILRKGAIRRGHFSHGHNSLCNPESVLHRAAKYLIVKRVNENNKINLKTKCKACLDEKKSYRFGTISCGREYVHSTIGVPGDEAVEEYRLASGRIADVVIFRHGHLFMVVEIFHTHQVDAEKEIDLLNVPWIEVEAHTITATCSDISAINDNICKCKYVDECNDIIEKEKKYLIDCRNLALKRITRVATSQREISIYIEDKKKGDISIGDVIFGYGHVVREKRVALDLRFLNIKCDTSEPNIIFNTGNEEYFFMGFDYWNRHGILSSPQGFQHKSKFSMWFIFDVQSLGSNSFKAFDWDARHMSMPIAKLARHSVIVNAKDAIVNLLNDGFHCVHCSYLMFLKKDQGRTTHFCHSKNRYCSLDKVIRGLTISTSEKTENRGVAEKTENRVDGVIDERNKREREQERISAREQYEFVSKPCKRKSKTRSASNGHYCTPIDKELIKFWKPI